MVQKKWNRLLNQMIPMRSISCFITSVLMLSLISSCGSQNTKQENNFDLIHSYFDKMDHACPIYIADGIYVTSISYSDEHKLVTYNFKCSDSFDEAEIRSFSLELASNTKYMCLYQYTIFDATSDDIALNNALIDEGYSYCWCFYKDDGSESGRYISKLVLDSYDLSSAKAFAQQHPGSARMEVMENIVRQYNDLLPLEIEDGWDLLSAALFRDYQPSYDTLFLFRLRIPPAYTVFEIRDDLKKALQYELNTNPFFENSVIVGHSIQSGIAFRVINHNYSDSLLIRYPNYLIREAADK